MWYLVYLARFKTFTAPFLGDSFSTALCFYHTHLIIIFVQLESFLITFPHPTASRWQMLHTTFLPRDLAMQCHLLFHPLTGCSRCLRSRWLLEGYPSLICTCQPISKCLLPCVTKSAVCWQVCLSRNSSSCHEELNLVGEWLEEAYTGKSFPAFCNWKQPSLYTSCRNLQLAKTLTHPFLTL